MSLRWQDVPGWCDFEEIYANAVDRAPPRGAHFVEVGTLFGKSALCMATLIRDSGKHIRFDTIDRQTTSDSCHARDSIAHIRNLVGITPEQEIDFDEAMKIGPTMRHAFQYYAQSSGVSSFLNPIEKSDLDAVKDYPDESLDFFFLDADHRYEATKASLLAWLPKMMPGSVFAGHDYTEHFPGVKQAVDEILRGKDVRLQGSSYWTVL